MPRKCHHPGAVISYCMYICVEVMTAACCLVLALAKINSSKHWARLCCQRWHHTSHSAPTPPITYTCLGRHVAIYVTLNKHLIACLYVYARMYSMERMFELGHLPYSQELSVLFLIWCPSTLRPVDLFMPTTTWREAVTATTHAQSVCLHPRLMPCT